MTYKSLLFAALVVGLTLLGMQWATAGEIAITCVEIGDTIRCFLIDVGWKV